MAAAERRRRNQRFLERLLARRPQDRAYYDGLLAPPARLGAVEEGTEGLHRAVARDLALETIVHRERPVLFVQDGTFNTTEVTELGPEARELVDGLRQAAAALGPVLPLIGRIDVTNFPGSYVGTGWLIAPEIVVTNRHVAALIARWDGRKFQFSLGIGGRRVGAAFCTAHEYDDPLTPSQSFAVDEVLYIERDQEPHDIAFLKLRGFQATNGPPFVPLADADVTDRAPVCVVGYPARAPRQVIPDQALMEELYRGRYDVKRAAPGLGMGLRDGLCEHDCTTLGGNSGSVVLDLQGRAVGLHFAGKFEEANYAVPVSVLRQYVLQQRWNRPYPLLSPRPQPEPHDPEGSLTSTSPLNVAAGVGVSISVPLTITVALGRATLGSPAAQPPAHPAASVARVREALPRFWGQRPREVVAARLGYFDAGDAIGDRPCLVAAVSPAAWATYAARDTTDFKGVPVRYLPAEVDEQLAALPAFEAVGAIAYDDHARTGEGFSLEPIEDTMHVRLHVGPEYSWDVLRNFLNQARGQLVSGIYEFHARHVQEALEARLADGAALTLVCDNATFAEVRDASEEFDRAAVFEEWAERYRFKRVVAPEGAQGLIANAYHIKVTVREDGALWLSSGNWKMGSSQPPITPAQRDRATQVDLPGNREWHVVVTHPGLAGRFRQHILQDYQRAVELGAGSVPRRLMDETWVDVPESAFAEAVVLERRPPGYLLQPRDVGGRPIRVRPLLTPDRQGAAYCEPVLELIHSARHRLLFQIPYIGMPPNPTEDRGYIDRLIEALAEKLLNLEDARVLLRSGGSNHSSPTHAAWYFKSLGVDVSERVRVVANHHTKGMIVDGQRVLVGSHNWSRPGVTLNRDASLLFEDAEIAEYFAEAFEIDWARANPVRPRRYRRPEAVVVEAVGAGPPPGYRRVRLRDWLADD